MNNKGNYVDLFLLAVPRKKLTTYRRMASGFGRYMKKSGALDYREFLCDDLHPKGMTPFTRYYKLRPGEALIGSYVLYRSRAERDRINKKMMNDPDMKKSMAEPMPFDMKRMLYGGFKTIVRMP